MKKRGSLSCEPYTALAAYYDRLNADIDYSAWADFLLRCFDRCGCRPALALDLACGTGSMTLELAARGIEMIGSDLSCEMLSEARSRAAEQKRELLFICQDMCALELYGTVDAVICCLDSINYLTAQRQLDACFGGVRRYLNKGGVFVFDVNTPYKFSEIYGERDYILEEDGVLCAWRNSYSPKSGLCRFDLSLFIEGKDGRYTRCDEVQQERCWSMRTLKGALQRAGLTLEGVYGDYAFAPAADGDERWYFVCRRD